MSYFSESKGLYLIHFLSNLYYQRKTVILMSLKFTHFNFEVSFLKLLLETYNYLIFKYHSLLSQHRRISVNNGRLVYRRSSRTGNVIQRYPVSTNKHIRAWCSMSLILALEAEAGGPIPWRGSGPLIQVVDYNHLQLCFQGIQCPLLTSKGTRNIVVTHSYMQAKHLFTEHKQMNK